MVESRVLDSSILTTDVDSLFEKHTVKQLHDFEKNVRAEIEKKKEDVRQMVGERYRDLIEAADTITEMKKSIQNVTLHISSMEKQVTALENRDFSTKPLQFRQNKKEDSFKQYYNLAAQIKLLLDIPGKIWCLIEANQFLSAARLFLLARHIHSSLLAESSLGIPTTAWFPVISRQWMTTGHFKMTLIDACKITLRQHLVTPEVLSQCCGALLILSNLSTQDVCNEFLNARLKCIQDFFKPDKQDSIKEQICKAVQLIIGTIQLLHSVFLEKPSENCSSMLMTALQDVIDSKQSNPLVNDSELSSISDILILKSICDFNFVLPQCLVPMSQMEVRDKAINWIQEVKIQINKDVSKVLNYVKSIRGLTIIRDSVCEVINENHRDKNWSVMCNQLLHSDFLLWEEIIQVLFAEQMKIIIHSRLKDAFEEVGEKVTEFMETMRDDKIIANERDTSAFIWTESSYDLPSKISWMSASSRNVSEGGNLLMKARGFTPFSQNLCYMLNSQLTTLLQDIAHFHSGCSDNDKIFEEVKNYLRSATGRFVENLLDKCKSLVESQKELIKSESADAELCLTRILALARVLTGMTELCPALQYCIVGIKLNQEEQNIPKMLARRESKMIDESVWEANKKTILESAYNCFEQWKRVVVSQLAIHLQRTMKFSTPSDILLYLPQWETVDIQEENEDGKVVTSKIRIPGQASWPILNTLYSLCSEINRAGGHTLPRIVLQTMQMEIAETILKSHEDVAQDKTIKLSQVLVLQLLFDLNFVCSLMSVKEFKHLTKRVQNLTDLLEAHVDPFDLDVFTPHIQNNLRRSIQRSSTLLGSLVNPAKIGIFTTANRVVSSSSQSEMHNILISSPSVPVRFSLLPIPSRLGIEMVDRNKSETTRMTVAGTADASNKTVTRQAIKRNQAHLSSPSNSLNLSLSPVKSTAASIFEAVSSSWLRN